MKVYLINLDRNAERLDKSSAQLVAAGLSFERFSAVDGQSMDESSLRRYASYFRWWCCTGLVPSKGEIGCALSHLGVYRDMLAQGEKTACVFEDDVVIEDPAMLQERLLECETLLSEEVPFVVLLSNHGGGARGTGLVRAKTGMCSEAYVVNDKAAELILKANVPVSVPADTWGRWRRLYGLHLYHSLPALCTQDWHEGFKSDVMAGRVVPRQRNGMWYLKRAFGKMVDIILCFHGRCFSRWGLL